MFQFGLIDRKASQNVILKIITEDGLVGYGKTETFDLSRLSPARFSGKPKEAEAALHLL